ncbi:MAG: hypothetical protein RIS29_1812 [Bacteroidota bacterium]|jgi:hypothetical protein
MKNKFSIIAACIALTLISCDKKEDAVASADSSITTSGTITGQITNYSDNSAVLDSVYAEDIDSTNYPGSAKIATDGKFSISLKTLPKLLAISSMEGVSISDTAALTGTVQLNSSVDDGRTGYIVRCNYTNPTKVTSGMAASIFVYSDRAVTIKGTYSDIYKDRGITNNETIVYNVKLQKGWNEVVRKVDEKSSTSTTYTFKGTVTSTIPADFKWVYLNSSNGPFTVKQQAKTAFIRKDALFFTK